MEHLWTQMVILFCFRLTEEVNGLMNELNNFFNSAIKHHRMKRCIPNSCFQSYFASQFTTLAFLIEIEGMHRFSTGQIPEESIPI